MFRENRESINKKVDDPGLLFVNDVRNKIEGDGITDWEEYKKSISELLYDTVAKGDLKEIEKIVLQVKRFDELMSEHEKRSGKSLIQANGEE